MSTTTYLIWAAICSFGLWALIMRQSRKNVPRMARWQIAAVALAACLFGAGLPRFADIWLGADTFPEWTKATRSFYFAAIGLIYISDIGHLSDLYTSTRKIGVFFVCLGTLMSAADILTYVART